MSNPFTADIIGRLVVIQDTPLKDETELDLKKMRKIIGIVSAVVVDRGVATVWIKDGGVHNLHARGRSIEIFAMDRRGGMNPLGYFETE